MSATVFSKNHFTFVQHIVHGAAEKLFAENTHRLDICISCTNATKLSKIHISHV